MTDVIEPVIEIADLHKSFGAVHAVRGIGFSVNRGELFAFLGVNGAGKSTTIAMLCGQMKKDSGSVRIDGKSMEEDPDGIKRALGVVFQDSVLDRSLTVWDNLECRAAWYGMDAPAFRERMAELSAMLDLEELWHRPLGKLSGGQRRRIDIARALLHRPKILILDEPTTGLDPQTRKQVWQVIARLQREEKLTVLLTTHYMEEAADADRVVVIDSGVIVASGSPLELKNAYTGDFITLYGVSEAEAASLGMPYEPIPDAYRIAVPDTGAATRLIIEHPSLFRDYEITKGKMDDVFLAVTGKTLERADEREDKRRKGRR